MNEFGESSKPQKHRTRCKPALVILNNRIEIVELIREGIHPAVGDRADEPLALAVLGGKGWRFAFRFTQNGNSPPVGGGKPTSSAMKANQVGRYCGGHLINVSLPDTLVPIPCAWPTNHD